MGIIGFKRPDMNYKAFSSRVKDGIQNCAATRLAKVLKSS